MGILIILLIVLVPTIYVRLAPSDPAQWHKGFEPAGVETQKLKGGYLWRQPVEDDGKELLSAWDAAARLTLRTTRLAGSVEAGQVTYITRSLIYGFPDYSTMGIYTAPDGQRYVEVYARKRFGSSDLGVNAKRVKGWRAIVEGR